MPTNEIVLEPLPNLDVVRDLVVDMSPFWEKYRRVRPWLHNAIAGSNGRKGAGCCDCSPGGTSGSEPTVREQVQSPREFQRIEQYINCILCACCYGSCPVLKRQPDYLGPAALAKLHRFLADTRDQRSPEQLEEVDNADGLWGCDTVYRCMDACPKDVRPTDGITALRRRLVLYRARKLLTRSERPMPAMAAPQFSASEAINTTRGEGHETP